MKNVFRTRAVMKGSLFEMRPSLEMGTQRKLKSHGKKANTIPEHIQRSGEATRDASFFVQILLILLPRDHTGIQQMFRNVKKLLLSHTHEGNPLLITN